MAGNATTRFDNVSLLSVASTLPSRVTTSEEIEDRLAVALARLKLPGGLLQRVAGVLERRNWAAGESSDDATVSAGERALAEAGVDPSEVGLLINTSVTRKHLEPSVAVRLHHGLGLPSSAINFDVANACLGFVSGMSLAASMIESGQIRYAIVVNGEDADEIQINTIERLLRPMSAATAFMSEFASLTLGSGAAAAVLGRTDEHPGGSPHPRRSHARRDAVPRALRRQRRRHVHRCEGAPEGRPRPRGLRVEGGVIRVELVVDGPLHHASGVVGAHERDRQGGEARSHSRAGDVPPVRQRRARLDSDHARRGAGDAHARATACC